MEAEHFQIRYMQCIYSYLYTYFFLIKELRTGFNFKLIYFVVNIQVQSVVLYSGVGDRST